MQNLENQYEEINLADYVKVILKRIKSIILIVILALASAFVFSVLSPKIHKIDSALEIGRIGQDLIESPGQLVEKIKNGVYNGKYQVGVIASNPQNTKLLIMQIESADSQKAQNVLGEVSNLIITEHQEKLEIQKDLIQKDIDQINSKIILLDEEIKNNQNKTALAQDDIAQTKAKKDIIDNNISKIQNKIITNQDDIERIYKKIDSKEKEKQALQDKVNALEKQLIYEQDPGTQFALFSAKQELENKNQEIENLYLEINSLKRAMEDYDVQINSSEREKRDIDIQINFLEASKQDYNIQINSLQADQDDLALEINKLNKSLEDIEPTKIIKQPTVSKFPIKPRPLLNTAIAGVLGLFIAVFLAFGREWWQSAISSKL